MALFSVTLGNRDEQTTPFSKFCIPIHKDFKFGKQVNSSKSYPADDKSSLKGAWSVHVNHLNFGGHQPYLWNG